MDMMQKRLNTLVVSLLWCVSAFAQAPAGYYNACEGKSGKTLLKALHSTISSHEDVGYSGLWDVYETSDVRANGSVWDMYSTKEWVVGAERCGNYSGVGDCINREHAIPQSWFNEASPMKSDAFHVYPTDGKVNGQRSNYPHGECANGSSLSSKNGVKPLGKLGTSTYPGYSGKVFEPDDEYKGDFARTYFYMATCYNDKIASWDGAIIAGNDYPCYSSWAIELYLKWHRQDPVSQKEIDRNNAVYAHQKNRNPYIDYPDLAEHVWGNKTTESWSADGTIDPTINMPIDGSTIDMGVTAINVLRSATVTVKGVALTENVKVAVYGLGFSASTASLTASAVNSEDGAQFKVNYQSGVAGTFTGQLVLTSGSCKTTVNLTAEALTGLPAGDATDVTMSSFVAHWINIDGDDETMQYNINVYSDGQVVAGYPVSVAASAEQYMVENLEPETTYTYTVSSATHVSNTVTVTTAAPIPVIQLLYNGELTFNTIPGTPSEVAEVEVYTEYVENDVTVSVTAPFEVSTDKSTWSQTVALDVLEDRFYLRVNTEKEGTYSTTINAMSGDCSAEPLDVTALVTLATTFIEDFEQDATGMDTYSPLDLYDGTASIWKFSNAGIFSGDSNANGEQSVRFGKNTDSYIEMTEDKLLGAGTVSFVAAKWGSDTDAKIDVQYSTDGGGTWAVAGSVDVTLSALNKFTVTINKTGNIRLRFQQTAGKRLNIDDVEVSNHLPTSVDVPMSDGENVWDAYSAGGELVIESNGTTALRVYSVDGVLYYTGVPMGGVTKMTLAKGLYIVSSDDDARRVLVK